MLKLRMDDTTKAAFKKAIQSRPNLKCPKHIRFNPAQGRGAIVGGCSGCEKAMTAYNAYINMTNAVALYVTMTVDPYETAKPRTKKAEQNPK
jgi:hypothetical protein